MKNLNTKIIFTVVLISFQFAFQANATDWYVDNAASGVNNGTSWTDAWQSFADISWGSFSPGDTLYISGGTTEKIYNERLLIEDVNGSDGYPITIRIGQDSDHNGTVVIDNEYVPERWAPLTIRRSQFIVVSGQVGSGSEAKLKITRSASNGVSLEQLNDNIILRNIEVYNNGDGGEESGINFNLNQPPTNIEVCYCDIHDNYMDGLSLASSGEDNINNFDAVKIHHNKIYNIADDGIESGLFGLSIYNNEIGNRLIIHRGHPDALQLYGNYLKVYNNYLYDWINNDSISFIEGPFLAGALNVMYIESDGGDQTDRLYAGHILIYNNLIVETEPLLYGYTSNAICMALTDPDWTEVSDIYIFNNTISGDFINGIGVSFVGVPNSEMVQDFYILNNNLYNCTIDFGSPLAFYVTDGDMNDITIGDYGSTSDVVVDYNCIYGTGTADMPGYPDNLGYNVNGIVIDPLVNPDFTPSSENSPIINVGFDITTIARLQSILSLEELADLRIDIDGNSHSSWDIGAYEYVAGNTQDPFSNTYYVRQGATGSNDGSDWNNTYTELPSALIRGATYYIADGQYPPYDFDDAESGEEYITIKKAIESDHGTGSGWLNSYGDGQAIFTSDGPHTWGMTHGYYIIDGQVGEKNEGHGIVVNTTYVGTSYIKLIIVDPGFNSGSTIENVVFNHIEGYHFIPEEGFGNSDGSPKSLVLEFSDTRSATIRNCYFHDTYYTASIGTARTENTTIEDSYFENVYWKEVVSDIASVRCVIRNNILKNTAGTSVCTLRESDDWEIYNNLFYWTDSRFVYTNAWVGTLSHDNDPDHGCNNIKVYGNTFANYNADGQSMGFNIQYSANGGNEVFNNIFYNCHANLPTPEGETFFVNFDHDYNLYYLVEDYRDEQDETPPLVASELNGQMGMEGLFIDPENGDFHLSQATGSGLDLGISFNTDIEGNTRGEDGVWDIGAFEYQYVYYDTLINITICENDSIFLSNSWQKTSGSYLDTIQSSTGADSIINTILKVNTVISNTLSATICEGESYLAGGLNQTKTGIYYDTLQNTYGCDSIVVTNLTVNSTSASTMDITICEGETHLAGGFNQTEAGTYYDTLQNTNGCDSIVITNLTVNSASASTKDITLCEGESYLAGGANQTASGTYTDVLENATGCDSVITTNLIVNICTDISTIEKDGIKIYPIPTHGLLYIDLNDFDKAELFNITGELLISTNEKIINFHEYNKGIYILKILDKNENAIIKKITYY